LIRLESSKASFFSQWNWIVDFGGYFTVAANNILWDWLLRQGRCMGGEWADLETQKITVFGQLSLQGTFDSKVWARKE
jgi:hypothetical protein